MIEILGMSLVDPADLDMPEIKSMDGMTAKEKEEGKACLREGLLLAPGVEEKLREAGLSLEEVEALLMRALGGEN